METVGITCTKNGKARVAVERLRCAIPDAFALFGLALHGGVIPYSGTFLVFSDYARNAVRMAALMKVPSIFVYSHDSIGLGEDGPTHHGAFDLSYLRQIPNLVVMAPKDHDELVQMLFNAPRFNRPVAIWSGVREMVGNRATMLTLRTARLDRARRSRRKWLHT